MSTITVVAFCFCSLVSIYGLYVMYRMWKVITWQREIITKLVSALDESTSLLAKATDAMREIEINCHD